VIYCGKGLCGCHCEIYKRRRQNSFGIVWDDGRRFEVDRVLDVTKAASLKAGGRGTRYKCRIRGKEIYLFLMMKNGLWKPEINSCRMQQDTINNNVE